MQPQIPTTQIISFIFNNVNKDEKRKIAKAINSHEATKAIYRAERKKYYVERYLDREMNMTERQVFEKLLKNDCPLNEHFILSKKINESLQLKKFREQLNKIHIELYGAVKSTDTVDSKHSPAHNEFDVKKRGHKIIQIGKWVAAASIVIAILSTGLFRILSNEAHFENNPYKAYYKSPIANNNAYFFKSSQFNRTQELFFEKDYEGALAILEDLAQSKPAEQEVFLFYGLTLMELERHSEAIEKFEILLDGNKDLKVIRSITNWYLGLCYVKTGQYQQAVGQFEVIVEHKGYNYKNAKKILKRIKKQQH
jgi:tetratricopeptide (TPR) repeat protein